jgi:hypothetical protein
MKTKRTATKAEPLTALTLYGYDASGNVAHGIVTLTKGKVLMSEVRKTMKAAGLVGFTVWFFWPKAYPHSGEDRRWASFALYEGYTRWLCRGARTNDVPEAVRTYSEWTY